MEPNLGEQGDRPEQRRSNGAIRGPGAGRAPTTSRIVFGPAFLQAIRARGLTLTEVAGRAHVVVATVSSAVRGHPVNITTALRLARVVSAAPIVPELETWARVPESPLGGGVESGVSDSDGSGPGRRLRQGGREG
ncbi:MAG: hypothetical protein ACYDCS_09315 [Candidatus Dormibacteria bacterium]